MNFTHGNGPYLRTTELALAINDELEKRGRERMGIVVPWVFPRRQKIMMEQNFREILKKNRKELFLDRNLGLLIHSLFYKEGTYEQSLSNLLENYEKTEKTIQEYFSNGLMAKDFFQNVVQIKKDDLAMEINRCPLVSLGVSPSYFSSFAYMSEVLDRFLNETDFKIDKELFKRGAAYYESLEKKQELHFIAEPATFFYRGQRLPKYPTEEQTPPSTNQLPYLHFPFYRYVRKGVYVTITGVDWLERLFSEFDKLGLKIYSHKLKPFKNAKRTTPGILTRKNLLFHIARVGWGSAWLSMLTEKPLIVLPYDPSDDPEIYFNNLCLEKLGLCKIYNGQSLEELLEFGEQYKKSAREMKNYLMQKYGTLNGVEYMAKKIVDHYLSKHN